QEPLVLFRQGFHKPPVGNNVVLPILAVIGRNFFFKIAVFGIIKGREPLFQLRLVLLKRLIQFPLPPFPVGHPLSSPWGNPCCIPSYPVTLLCAGFLPAHHPPQKAPSAASLWKPHRRAAQRSEPLPAHWPDNSG